MPELKLNIVYNFRAGWRHLSLDDDCIVFNSNKKWTLFILWHTHLSHSPITKQIKRFVTCWTQRFATTKCHRALTSSFILHCCVTHTKWINVWWRMQKTNCFSLWQFMITSTICGSPPQPNWTSPCGGRTTYQMMGWDICLSAFMLLIKHIWPYSG